MTEGESVEVERVSRSEFEVQFAERAWEIRFAKMLTRPAPLTRAIIVFLCAVHIVLLTVTANSVLGGPTHAEDHLVRLVLVGAKSNALIDGGEWWRFASAMFLHAGWIHLLFNVMALHYLGRIVENALGVSGFLLIYFGGGLVASYFSYLYSSNISVGASGSVFALLGAAAAYGIYNRDRIPSRLKRFLVVSPLVWIGLNVVVSLSIPKIDVAAHAGGLVVGVLCTPFLGDRILLRPSTLPNVLRKGLLLVVMCSIVASLGFWGPRMLGVAIHVPSEVEVVEVENLPIVVPIGWTRIASFQHENFDRFAANAGYKEEERSVAQVFQDNIPATRLIVSPQSNLGGDFDRILKGEYEENLQETSLRRIKSNSDAKIYEFVFLESQVAGPKYRRMITLGANGSLYDIWVYEKLFDYYLPVMESLHRWRTP